MAGFPLPQLRIREQLNTVEPSVNQNDETSEPTNVIDNHSSSSDTESEELIYSEEDSDLSEAENEINSSTMSDKHAAYREEGLLRPSQLIVRFGADKINANSQHYIKYISQIFNEHKGILTEKINLLGQIKAVIPDATQIDQTELNPLNGHSQDFARINHALRDMGHGDYFYRYQTPLQSISNGMTKLKEQFNKTGPAIDFTSLEETVTLLIKIVTEFKNIPVFIDDIKSKVSEEARGRDFEERQQFRLASLQPEMDIREEEETNRYETTKPGSL